MSNNLPIGKLATVRNDRGGLFKGVVLAHFPNGDVLMEVHEINLAGRLVEDKWHVLKRREQQRVTGPERIT